MVPETYIRKQTLTNCERYITQDLKDVEGRILGAKDRSVALEYNLFDDVRKTVSDNLERIQKTAKAIANLDVITSLANVAADNRYIRPDVNLSTAIRIKDSRHRFRHGVMHKFELCGPIQTARHFCADSKF